MIRSALFVAILAACPVAAQERTFGLVIGIDEYVHITDLHGAVNDARDIADALQSIGAEVTLLLNEEANRDTVLSEWRRIAGALSPGDRFFVTYAGHGANEPEAHPGSEADGRDENFLLAGFAPAGEAAAERIRDDEIAELLQLSAHARTVFVADACHSGSLTRDISPSLGYRYTAIRDLEGDPLPPPPPPVLGREEGRNDAALFLAAVDESLKVPEFLIAGEARGALSYAFAAGLRGDADANRDGTLTKGELETFVRKSVRLISDGLQRPQVSPDGATETPIVAVPMPDQEVREFKGPFDALPIIRFYHDGPSSLERTFSSLTGVARVDNPQSADLRFVSGTGKLVSMVGDTVRIVPEGLPSLVRREVQMTVDTLRLVRLLSETDAGHVIQFSEGDGTYTEDAEFVASVLDRGTPHVTLLNIAADGTIAYLYPISEMGDPDLLDMASSLDLPLQVSAPFGADHFFAITSGDPLDDLNRRLSRMNGTRDIRGLWNALVDAAPDVEIAVFPFHTEAR